MSADNTYEATTQVRYENQPSGYLNMQVNGNDLKQTQAPACSSNMRNLPAVPPEKKGRSQKFWKIFSVATMILLVTVFGLAINFMIKSSNLEATAAASNLNCQRNSGKSCLDLKSQGVTESGYYSIQPDGSEWPFTTYCDMETDGGGWTLVATVHENNIDNKCTIGDSWFTNEEPRATSTMATRNWENKNTFGRVDEATSGDYKNPGYYSMTASDIMVRHVPNDKPVVRSKEEATLEYYTNNKFLDSYGGNLYNVYTKHYSLSPVTNLANQPTYVSDMLDALASNANDIISDIPDFYQYQYSPGSTTYLNNAGNNMFTYYSMQVYGNMGCGNTNTHGVKYECGAPYYYTLSSRKVHPFFALFGIGNYELSSSQAYLRVQSYRPRTDPSTTHSGTLVNGNFQLKYNAYCRYNTTVPSLCDVMYLVTNSKDWHSPDSLTTAPTENTQSTYYYFHFYVRNYPTNAVMGYTMLSRTSGMLVNKTHTESALNKILAIIAKFGDIAPSCGQSSNHLVVPVQYTVPNNADTVLSGIPPSVRYGATPGFLQIRSRNAAGRAYAFCPGIRVETCRSDYLCVGGVRNDYTRSDDCSDFLDWDGPGSNNALDLYRPKGFAHSLSDLHSTIMIFYR